MISVIIPTVRTIELNEKCLARQTFQDFELIVARPKEKPRKGRFWSFFEDMNNALRKAKGELMVSYQDMIEIRPDTLERFWSHYKDNKKACVGAVGDQYSLLEPPIKVWQDPRRRTDFGTFYEVEPNDIEFTLCSIPMEAIWQVGGFDEKYDDGAAVGEKELMYRIDRAGYKTYLDQSIEYKAIHHPRLTKDWDHYYLINSAYYAKDVDNIRSGRRDKVDFLQR